MRSLEMLVLGVGVATPAAAQTEAASLALLQAVVKPGELVVVTDDSGHETRGIVSELTEAALSLENETFSLTTIHAVRRTDPLGNGTLAGLAAGIGVTFAFATRCGRYEFSEERGPCQAAAVTSALLVVPLAMLVGRQIDRAVGDRELYRRQAHDMARVSLVPRRSPAGLGVQLSVAFSLGP